MKLGELMEDLGCKYYYVVELDANLDIEDCPEYYTSAEDIDPELLDLDVLDYEHISRDFAVIYLNITNKDEIKDLLIVDNLIDSVREIAIAIEEPLEMTIKTYPESKMFSMNVKGFPVYFPYDKEDS